MTRLRIGAGRVLAACVAVAAASALQQCPRTKWDCSMPTDASTYVRRRQFLQQIKPPPDCLRQDESVWLRQNAATLVKQLDEAGALHFRGFALPRSTAGLKCFCEALSPLAACQDPLASVGVRKLLSQSDGVYEAVNAEALSKTFIGLHNDATFKLTAPFAAFACLQPAAIGGEFLLVDGRRLLADLPRHVLEPLYDRNVSVRVAALDLSSLSHMGVLRAPLRALAFSTVRLVLDLLVPLNLELAWAGGILQILERPKPPINRHPTSQEPTFFSSLHSQSRYLQSKRAGIFSDSKLSSIASTDVFYGDDLSPIEPWLLDELDRVMTEATCSLKMRKGDVVLLDSYQVLHGRDTFEGAREHAVMWLTVAPPHG